MSIISQSLQNSEHIIQFLCFFKNFYAINCVSILKQLFTSVFVNILEYIINSLLFIDIQLHLLVQFAT